MAIRLFGFAITAFVICTLTEQRREAYRREAHARRTAEDALRLRDLLLATVAHDLKSPVGVILMRTQLLQRRLDHGTVADFAAVQAGLTSIESTAQRIMGIIDHQLDIARVVSDQAIPLDSRPLDLVTLIREKVHEWQETADEHAIVFATTLPSLTGRWDAARLERVLDNLLSNAIKYSPMGGTITVTLARERHPQEDEIVITVQDEGIGIPAADIPKIFTPFHRAGNVVNVVAGNGVGLASARALVEQYGGTISVTSTERQGTTFTIRLPIAH